ncbi:hypothetical protein HZS_7819 [Henneguya salminicola]|nr:hypothetical protein HZS_7819 [Henneguya salminicola]
MLEIIFSFISIRCFKYILYSMIMSIHIICFIPVNTIAVFIYFKNKSNNDYYDHKELKKLLENNNISHPPFRILESFN